MALPSVTFIDRGTKICSICKVEKSLDNFRVVKGRRGGGFASRCFLCEPIDSRKWNKKNHEKRKQSYLIWLSKNVSHRRAYERRRLLRRHYNLTEEEYNDILRGQNYLCAICGLDQMNDPRKKFLNVDHDHSTGFVRGLLCDNCNKMLGNSKDSPTNLRRAADYLESRSGVHVAGPGCLSCGCDLPAQGHRDERTITYKEYMAGDRDFRAAAAYNKADGKKGTIAEAKTITNKTLAAIEAGRLSPNKRK